MSIVKTEAVVLKSDNFRHSSKIITLLTKEFGKIKCIGKGVRDVKCKWGSVIQPMAYINIVIYYKDNGTLHLLSNADHMEYFGTNFQEFDKISAGLQMVELVNLTTAYDHKYVEIFNMLVSYLRLLDRAESGEKNIFFAFKSRLAGILGFGINLKSLRPSVNYDSGIMVKEFEENLYGKFRLSDLNLNIVETLIKGNFNDILSLNISDECASSINKFFDDYYSLHYDDLKFKVNRIF